MARRSRREMEDGGEAPGTEDGRMEASGAHATRVECGVRAGGSGAGDVVDLTQERGAQEEGGRDVREDETQGGEAKRPRARGEGKSTRKEYPTALRELVTKVIRLCETSAEKRAAVCELKRIVAASEANGTVWTRNWEQTDPRMIIDALGFAADVDRAAPANEVGRGEGHTAPERSRSGGDPIAGVPPERTHAQAPPEVAPLQMEGGQTQNGRALNEAAAAATTMAMTLGQRDAPTIDEAIAALRLDLMDPRVFERGWILRTGCEALLRRMDAAIDDLTPARNALVDRVKQAANLMRTSYPHAYELVDAVEVRRFGSSASGLDTPSSDVDLSIVLLLRDGTPLALGRSQRILALQHLRVCLDSCAREAGGWQALGTRYHLDVRSTARIPLLTGWVATEGGHGAVNSGCGLEVRFDVSFSDEYTQIAIEQAASARAAWVRMPVLRGVIRIIKFFLDRRGIGSVYKGGLGSFSLFCMARVCVSTFAERHRGMGGDQAHIGLYLLDFYHVYGILWNESPVPLCVSERLGSFIDANSCLFPNVEKARLSFWVPPLRERLVVEDPASTAPQLRDIGYATYKWADDVQPEIAMFYDVALMSEANLLSHGMDRKLLGRTDVAVLERKPGFLDAILFVAQFRKSDDKLSFADAELPPWRFASPPAEVHPQGHLTYEGEFSDEFLQSS